MPQGTAQIAEKQQARSVLWRGNNTLPSLLPRVHGAVESFRGLKIFLLWLRGDTIQRVEWLDVGKRLTKAIQIGQLGRLAVPFPPPIHFAKWEKPVLWASSSSASMQQERAVFTGQLDVELRLDL
jgi:hypothetical protein